MLPSREYLAKQLTPYPLPTTDDGVLRTIGDARDYMLALSKERERRADWQHACRPLMEEAGVAAVTRQVHLALFTDAMLDIEAFERMSSARRWRPGTADTFFPVPDDDAARRPRQSQKGQLGSSREGPCDERPERSFFLCYLERVRRFCSRD